MIDEDVLEAHRVSAEHERCATGAADRQCGERRAAVHAAVHVVPSRRQRGGRLGPDLTRIGVQRSHAALTREIRHAVRVGLPAFETVTIVTKDGQRVRGAKKAEDVFSIQVMDTRERIQGYRKSDLRKWFVRSPR